MKSKLFTFSLLMALLFSGLLSQAQWQLVWSDEFNYTGTPNTSLWRYDIWNPKRVNNELQSYTNRWENARVENGSLIIEARRDNYNGEYSSARLNSTAGWTYGRFEARMKLPGGWGTWPAFWLYPDNESVYGWNSETNYWWPNCGEIDIMEEVGYDQNRIHSSVHSKNFYFKKGNQRTGSTVNSTVTSAYHVYACEWYADRIDFFVDNTKFFTVNNDGSGWESYPFNHNFHIILNLAVGGDWGGAQGVDPNIWPRKLEIDYVRVYKQAASTWTIALQGSNGKFVSSENGTTAIMCNRNTVGGWEKFDVINTSDGKFALRGTNGKYLSSENGTKAMMCDRNSIGDWEKFTWVELGGNSFAIKGSNGKYVSSENGTKGMTCTRESAGGWETFIWSTQTKSAELNLNPTKQEESAALKVYPNPAKGVITIEGVDENETIEIFNTIGSKVATFKGNSFDVSHLKKGSYLISTATHKQLFVKQ